VATAWLSDRSFLDHETGEHPESPLRITAIDEALRSDPTLWADLVHRTPTPASVKDLTRCHSLDLVDHIRESSESGVVALDADTRISLRSFDVACLAAGASLEAVDLVMTGEVSNAFAAVRPPGHHAGRSAAMGFCLFNNVAIAARYAQSRYDVERVLILDWDVHHGNGTQEIFYEDPSVFYLSMHQSPWYPGTGSVTETGRGPGEGTTRNIPVPGGTPAMVMREALRDALRELVERFRPDLVMISAGFDSHRDDPLGRLLLEDSDFAGMTAEVAELAERFAGGRIVSVLEGGYHLGNLGAAVRSHIRALAGLRGV